MWVLVVTSIVSFAIVEKKEPEIIYVDVPATPEIVYVEIEKEVDSKCTAMVLPYYSAITENITEEEIDLLAKVTYLEAGNQSMTGQRGVVEVVLNRVLDDRFPNTIEEVLYQKNQFSVASRIQSAKPTEVQYDAVYMTLNTTEPILRDDVVFFARGIGKGQTLYEKIGDHCFCY